MALKIPFFLSCDCLVKKETVKGIIGNTQGVKRASKPPTKPKIKMPNNPVDFSEDEEIGSSKSSVFFKSNCNSWDNFLLLSSTEMVSEIAFPVNEIVKFSSTLMQAVSQICPKKLSFI